MQFNLKTPVKDLPLVGGVYTRRLESIGINTVEDLLYYFPFRYEDLSAHKDIKDLEIGEKVTIQASLWQITKIKTKFGKTIIKALVNDGQNSIDVIWFNQDYLLTVLKPNQVINFSGKVGLFGNKPALTNPTYEIIKNAVAAPIHTDRLVPVYSETNGLTSKWLRAKIYQILKDVPQIEDYLPNEILKTEELTNLFNALQLIHFPDTYDGFLKAKKRLAFDELLFLHLRNLKQARDKEKGSHSLKVEVESKTLREFEHNLPFKLTGSQKEAINEILEGISKEKPMHRLLQGEVGSGKTVVSCFGFKACIENNLQGALLAPTEVLARQHYQTLQKFLGQEAKIKLVTGASKPNLEEFDILVGTHALLNQAQHFKRLAFIVIDEQQRFGVVQRSVLKQITPSPHLLTMTATPIPRTLALTLYGQMDISVLEELPSGRKEVKTYLVPRLKRDKAYEFIKKEIKSGGQVFIICPLIEESESLLTVKSAKSEFERLKKEIFPEFKLELLHGKMSSKEKQTVLEKFKDKKAHILVSTPVVEVGIDIPNASIMVIEGSERFGLSSLHQLRGRVGRGERQSFCFLFTENRSEKVQNRLKLMERFNNGLRLAEMDLEQRGPGEIYGILQHGQIGLKLANTSDLNLIVSTRDFAEKLMSNGLPEKLEEKLNESIKEKELAIED